MGIAEQLVKEQYHDQALPADSPLVYALLARKVNPIGTAKAVVNGVQKAIEFLPYIKDVWEGRNILLRKPYDLMSKEEKNQYLNDTENYFKNTLVDNPVGTKWGQVDFRSNKAGETKPSMRWQYPFARYNLSRAIKNTKMPNTKTYRKDANIFDNVEVDIFGKKYDYQIRNNTNDKTKDLYNIKPYELLEKDIENLKNNNPELYDVFLKLQE